MEKRYTGYAPIPDMRPDDAPVCGNCRSYGLVEDRRCFWKWLSWCRITGRPHLPEDVCDVSEEERRRK